MIIGITGSDGAGKGTVVEYLIQKGFAHYSSRAEITTGIERRQLPVNRENMRIVANEMRALHGKDVLVARALERMERDGTQDAVIESIRAVDEAKRIKAAGGILLSVDADQKVRYERIQARKSASDQVTFDEFVAHEALEMDDPDPNGMQKAKVMAMADYTIINDGQHDELHAAVETFLAKYQW